MHGKPVGINNTPGSQVWGGGESQVVPFGGENGLAMLIRARTIFSGSIDKEYKARDVSHNHALTFSSDGGETWANSTRMSGIKTVYCEGSLAAADNGDLLMSSPDTGNGVRANLTVWAAKKGSPTDFEYLLTIYRGSSAYSSMISLNSVKVNEGAVNGVNGEYINLFERENSKFISLARFAYP